MNTSDSRAVMALAEIADRQARQLRTLKNCQLVQGISLLFLGLAQLMHAFAFARGMK